MTARGKWKDITNINVLQKFIEGNKILSPSDFKNRYYSLYSYSQKRNWLNKIIYPSSRQRDWGFITSLEETQNYINSNKILNKRDFCLNYSGLAKKAKENEWYNKLVFEKNLNSWEKFNNKEDVQKFIDENDIQSPEELKQKYNGLWNKSRRNKWLPELVFIKRYRSFMEIKFDELFPIKDYPSFIRNRGCFDWLVYKKRLRPDIVIPEIKLVIEFQGSQHFIKGSGFFDNQMELNEIKERDKIKHDLLTEHGYEVIYFVDIERQSELLLVEHLFDPGNYLGQIITTWKDLVEFINKKLQIS